METNYYMKWIKNYWIFNSILCLQFKFLNVEKWYCDGWKRMNSLMIIIKIKSLVNSIPQISFRNVEIIIRILWKFFVLPTFHHHTNHNLNNLNLTNKAKLAITIVPPLDSSALAWIQYKGSHKISQAQTDINNLLSD